MSQEELKRYEQKRETVLNFKKSEPVSLHGKEFCVKFEDVMEWLGVRNKTKATARMFKELAIEQDYISRDNSYILTEDSATQFAMSERTPKAREVRDLVIMSQNILFKNLDPETVKKFQKENSDSSEDNYYSDNCTTQ